MSSLITLSKTLFILLSFAFASRFTYNYITKKKKQEIRKEKEEIHEVIMFSCNDERIMKSKYSRCMITNSMNRVLHYLNQPKYSLDICMYVWTNMDITDVVLKLYRRGVRIRVIIDADMAYATGSGIKRITKVEGIQIRWMKSTNLMHHKFCLVDTLSENPRLTPFVMTGSLNWTNQAMCGNYENCLVTTQKETIEQYRQEFEKLWILFKPIVD